MRYSMDFRKKVMAVKEAEGLSVRKVAARFNINFNTVQSWTRRVEPKKAGPKSTFVRKIDPEKLRALILEKNDMYQHEIAEHFGVSQPAVCHALRRIGIFLKKRGNTQKLMYTKKKNSNKLLRNI